MKSVNREKERGQIGTLIQKEREKERGVRDRERERGVGERERGRGKERDRHRP